jgi:hypothetical protein
MLPHSPYLGYLALGELASVVFAEPVALALLSAVAYIGSAVVLSWLSTALGADRLQARLASFLFLALPMCMRQSGIQEIYAAQGFFLLLGLYLLSGGTAWRQLAGSTAYAAAVSIHSASLFVLPACLYLLYSRDPWQGAASRRRATLTFLAPQALLGLVTLGWLSWAFRSLESPLQEAFIYLRGIAPVPRPDSPWQLIHGLGATARSLFDAANCGWPVAVALAAVIGAILCTRHSPRAALLWTAFVAGYLVYEALLGKSLDRRAYLVYFAPPLAFFAGGAIAAALAALRKLQRSSRVPAGLVRSMVNVGCTASILTGLGAFYATSLLRVREEAPRDEIRRYAADPLVVASRWIKESLPKETVVVQPRSVDNVNRLPSEHLHRPIIFQNGQYLLMRRYERWTPLNLRSYAQLTREELERLFSEGRPIVAFDLDLAREFALEAQRLPPSLGARAPLFQLVSPHPRSTMRRF